MADINDLLRGLAHASKGLLGAVGGYAAAATAFIAPTTAAGDDTHVQNVSSSVHPPDLVAALATRPVNPDTSIPTLTADELRDGLPAKAKGKGTTAAGTNSKSTTKKQSKKNPPKKGAAESAGAATTKSAGAAEAGAGAPVKKKKKKKATSSPGAASAGAESAAAKKKKGAKGAATKSARSTSGAAKAGPYSKKAAGKAAGKAEHHGTKSSLNLKPPAGQGRRDRGMPKPKYRESSSESEGYSSSSESVASDVTEWICDVCGENQGTDKAVAEAHEERCEQLKKKRASQPKGEKPTKKARKVSMGMSDSSSSGSGSDSGGSEMEELSDSEEEVLSVKKSEKTNFKAETKTVADYASAEDYDSGDMESDGSDD